MVEVTCFKRGICPTKETLISYDPRRGIDKRFDILVIELNLPCNDYNRSQECPTYKSLPEPRRAINDI